MIGNVIYVVMYGPYDETEAVAAFTSQGAALERAVALIAKTGFATERYESHDDVVRAFNNDNLHLGDGDGVFVNVTPLIVEG